MTKSELHISLIINAVIFLATTGIVISYFFKRKDQVEAIGKSAFKYFTTDSNIFAAVTALMVLIGELASKGEPYTYPHLLVLLKFFSTVAVALTFLTVMFYLGPSYGFPPMLGGTSFYMHLAGPVLAIYSLCFIEDFDKISLEESFVALVPSLIYYMIYTRQVLFAQTRDPKGTLKKGWEDFYGFNRTGKWPIVLIIMLVVILVISLVLRLLYNM